MHARRAFGQRALAPARRVGLARVLTVLWASCLMAGIIMLSNFGYGMWKGVSDQQHLNQVWTYQIGPTKAAPGSKYRRDAGTKRRWFWFLSSRSTPHL